MKFSNGLGSFQKCIITVDILQCNGAGGFFHVTSLHSGFDNEVSLISWL